VPRHVFRLEDCALVERFLQGVQVRASLMASPWASSRFRGCFLGGLRSVGHAAGSLCADPASRERHDSVLRLATQATMPWLRRPPVWSMLVSERLNETIVDIDTSPLLLPQVPAHHRGQSGLDYNDFIEEILRGARFVPTDATATASLQAHSRPDRRRPPFRTH